MIDTPATPTASSLRGYASPCRMISPRAVKAESLALQNDEKQPAAEANALSPGNRSHSPRKLALAVDPYKVAMSVSPRKTTPVSGLSRISQQRKIASTLSRYQQQLINKSQVGIANTNSETSNEAPSCVVAPTPLLPALSRPSISTTSWHDERIMKSLTYSKSFQRRLEYQAAEAMRKNEENTLQEYEKKLSKCLKTIEAVEKRKKNDLRLVELRKKAEMEKIQDEFVGEMFKQEMKDMKEMQDRLKARVLLFRAENTELQHNCRDIADRNKQIMSEIESHRRVLEECEQHKNIVAQLENIDGIFLQAHLEARQDLTRLDEDCRKEAREKKKIQHWIDSLIDLMDKRCNQPKLLEKIHRIDSRAKAQRTLITDLRRARQRSSKRSQRSGSTTVLRRKVSDMRKQAQAQTHIFEDHAKLSAALAPRRAQERQHAKTQHQFEHEYPPELATSPERYEQTVAHIRVDDLADKVKEAMKTNRRLKKRRKDIEDIVNEMKNLGVEEDPPDALSKMLSMS
jgi:hypothetical protein